MPFGPTVWMPPAARVSRAASRLSTEESGRGVPAGCVDTNPASRDSVTVTFNDIATASAGTPAGSGMVTEPPGGTIEVSRVSSNLVGGVDTRRPERETSAASNDPMVSITRSPPTEWNTSKLPSVPTVTIATFDRICPLEKLSIDAVGCAVPVGNRVTNPASSGSTITTDAAIAVGDDPIPHRPAADTRMRFGETRVNPVAERVSARRHGATGTNLETGAVRRKRRSRDDTRWRRHRDRGDECATRDPGPELPHVVRLLLPLLCPVVSPTGRDPPMRRDPGDRC